ncbi:hypothetical protein CK228_28485 [Mesorhizobium sp. WSM4312]|uniref:hypothetical protein n=1 Tax=unclassified Mesorhizobium TaxID=325217 RepID=UPI000BB009FC|nr:MULTISPECIES: hypothetical protein [unclassified Mesorhizobium]PBB65217.1 hypothetical protein CK228_28485 [Mesorhizobium sp. WSM4312]PBC18663.1 hypothetical protein CK226_33660 [Mesorhizobium sp. WSM4311]TRC78041.1 hypothetical protein FJV81_10715 [Mesorhizobium sp. WSM4315]TRC79230.1 hypothetical protein FJV83_28470 [Mesorhizobium sp. WSM4307]TRC80188.1 hypothetical protein FJV80_22705 [Mesorhizobium sp. WSM4310]
MSPDERTPAEARGEIQAGRTQDKTPGFDPAAVPQEADAEAGGVSTSAAPAATRNPNFTNQASFANAMRPPENAPHLKPRRNGPVLVILGLVVLPALAFLFAAALR